MNVNDEFNMMRFPVTNREFISFLNSNESLEVEIVEVLWGDENGNNYGNHNFVMIEMLEINMNQQSGGM